MRIDRDSFREILDALVRNRSRSLLTGFGIFWGLFMLLFLVGGGKGLKEMLAENFEGFASNSIIMVSQETSVPYKGLQEGRYWSLKTGDIERLKLMIPELDVVTGQLAAWGWSAVREGNSFSANVKGVNADYAKIEAPQMKYGRYINSVDVEQDRRVCVIGKKIYEIGVEKEKAYNAAKQAAELVARAKEEIEQDKKDAMESMKNEVVNVSISVAEKILKQKLSDSSEQNALISRMIDDIQKERKAGVN